MMKRTLTAAALAVVLASPAFAQTAKPDTMAKPDAAQTEMNKSDTAKPADTMNKADTKDTMSKDSMSKPSTSAQATTPAADQVAFVQNQDSTDWRGSKLIGATVYGPDNKSIGDINDLLLANDGQIKAVVIGVGGFLGVGEKNVAVPFEKLSVTRKADSSSIEKVTISYSKDELKNAPKFAYYEASEKSSTTGAASSMTDKKPLTPMSKDKAK